MLAFATGFGSKKSRLGSAPSSPRDSKTDYWKYCGDNLDLDQQSQTILSVKYLHEEGYNAGFGAISVNHGKHIWKIKIIRKTTKMCVGISSSTETINTNFHRQKTYPNYGYNWNGSKISHKTKYEDYGIPIKTGQIITIILDLDTKEITFMNDNDNLGVAFNDIVIGDTINYRIAISIVDKDDKVQLIGYGQFNDDDDDDDDDEDEYNGNKLDHLSMDEKQQQIQQKQEEEIMKLNVNEMESWNNKMCKKWIKWNINKENIEEMDGMDLLKLLNKLQDENGSFAAKEALQTECDKQQNMLQTLHQKIAKLTKKNNKLEKKINIANDEKDNLLLLYQVKEEEVQIAKTENARLRAKLMKLQKSLARK